ncbi:hypothetical protein MY11210_009726, partial [Beauveria gryllotalpidicola]
MSQTVVLSVKGRGGDLSHYFPEESRRVEAPVSELYEYAPPLYHPRDDWPEFEPYAEGGLGGELPEQDIREAFKNVENSFGLPSSDWPWHVSACYRLYSGLTQEKWAEGSGLLSALRIAVRGLGNSATVISDEFQIRGCPSPRFYKMDEARDGLEPGQEFVLGKVPFCHFLSEDAMKAKGILGYRFWVFAVNFTSFRDIYDGAHWATMVFDRKSAVLWFLDTMEIGRPARAKAAALAFRQWLNNVHFPYSFMLVCPPATDQGNGWSCGYLAIFNTMLLLRGCSGVGLQQLLEGNSGKKRFVEVEKPNVDGQQALLLTTKAFSDFLWLDWGSLCSTKKAADNLWKEALCHMLANELGMREPLPGSKPLRPVTLGTHNLNMARLLPRTIIGGAVPYKFNRAAPSSRRFLFPISDPHGRFDIPVNAL